MVDKDEVRDQIVESARLVFAKFGFRKTTMDEIAFSIRKGKSSIYYYYEGKEEIYKAVIEKEAFLLKTEIETTISKEKSPVDKLRSYVVTRMYTMQKMVNFYNAIKSDWLSSLDFVNKTREKFDKDEIQIIKSIFDEGVKKGLFIVNDTQLAAIAIVTSLKGLEAPLFLSNESHNLNQRIENIINIMFNGVLKH